LALGVVLALSWMQASAAGPEKIVLRTDYKFNGYVAPFALALEKGFYKEAGLDVSIEQGQGSGTTIQTVASGSDNFGLADASTAVLGISAQDMGVKIISVYTQTATMGLIFHPDSDFKGNLKSLKGKVVISSAGAADLRLLSPALASAGMKPEDVQLQLVDTNARVPLFLQTPGALLTGFAAGDLLRVRSRLPKAQYVPYAQYGVIAYGTGLITSDETIKKNPEMVRKFVAASRRGWEESVKNPDAAVAASLKLYPDLGRDLIRDGLKIALDEQLHTPGTQGRPIGWTNEQDWTKMIGMLQTYAGVKPKAASAYFSNQFISE
jgi:NitT/TauT family transport system substrate-binding protein